MKNTLPRLGTCILSILLFQAVLTAREWEVQLRSARVAQEIQILSLKQPLIRKYILPVFNDDPDGGLYFSNSLFPTRLPLLERLADLFHAQGLELWAWLGVRKYPWLKDDTLFDWEMVKGQLCRLPKLDLFNPRTIQLLRTMFRELAQKEIAGILIQDDLIIRHSEGLSTYGKAKYSEATGVPAEEKAMLQPGTIANYNWQRIKINQINLILQTLVRECKAVKPGLRLGVNVYYETPLFVQNSESWYGLNLQELLQCGVDFVYLMAYHRQLKEELHLSEEKARELFRQIVADAFRDCGDKLVVKMQLRDWNSKVRLHAEELRAYLQLIPPGVPRVCFTSVEPTDLPFLQRLLSE